jgi:hypothetical protein
MHNAADLIRAIATLAWPVFVLTAVLVFRRRLASVLSPVGPLRRARAGPTGLELEWERQRAEAEVEVEAAGGTPQQAPRDLAEDLAAVANALPSAAIMEAHARVEAELREMLEEAGVPAADLRRGGAARLARLAATRGLISDEAVRAVEGIGVLRNLAAHGRAGDLTAEQALDYLVLADSVLYAIRNPPRGG